MSKLWLILSCIFLVTALAGYLHQEIVGASWDWTQFWHHETVVGIFLSIGTTLMLMGLINMARTTINKLRKEQ